MKYKFLIFVSFFFLITSLNLDSQVKKGEIVRILGISVEGNDPTSGTETSAIIDRSGLKIGDEITIPGDQIRQAINRLWALRIFSDVQILIEKQIEDGVYLLIRVKEYPRLLRTEIQGADEVDEDDINKKITLTNGGILSPDEIQRSIEKIKALYAEEGHLLTTITTETKIEDSTKPNKQVLIFKIDEGPSIRIKEISFTGISVFDESDLEGEMEDTKEKKWWKFWSSPKFDRKKFQDDKKRIIKYYRKHGYIDAEILFDSIWYSEDKEEMFINISIYEGPQYKVRSITWEGATVYKPEILSERLGIKPGDIFNEEKFEQNLRANPEQMDVASLYLDNGYLMFNIDPIINRVAEDSLDIKIQINERHQFRINKVEIKGNMKTHDYVIRRELQTKPGDYFNRSAIIRSLRQLHQLNYFNPEKLKPDYRIVDEKNVDLTYEVEEKSSDNVNASIGYSQAFGVTGALGFTITNFSITDPLSGGAGQIFNFEWQFGEGARFRTFSLSFTEPWLYNTPTTFGVSLFDTRQIFVYDLQQTGASLRLGRRLKWPDDYFRTDWTFRFQRNIVHDNAGVPYYRIGRTTQYGVGQSISRISTDSPIFPTQGSSVSLSFEMAGGPLLPGNVDFHKWLFSVDWYTPIFGSSRLVFFSSTFLGYVDGFKRDSEIPPIEYFFMGGTGLGYIATTSLRGYEERSIGPRDERGYELGGRVITKHSFELRFAVTLNPMPVYLLGFTEAGNVYENFRRADFLDLKRSYGFGARLYVPPIGVIGFDYGYGMDDVTGDYNRPDGKPDGWKFHFQFGRGF